MGGKYIREIKPELWPDITFEWLVECVYMYKYSVSLRHGCAIILGLLGNLCDFTRPSERGYSDFANFLPYRSNHLAAALICGGSG